ncbi:glutamate ABC transporter substrate-binding protein [Micromonospora sp. NPDC049903]|uniref:glutamate ABC transporter substrate-binding protein n=1 Tax=Micromonospora sp. NPDC049903 TaxID=3364276 RepID=UPI0037AF2C5B
MESSTALAARGRRRPSGRRAVVLATAVALATALGVTAGCSSASLPAPPGTAAADGGAGGESIEKILADAPVADPADLSAGGRAATIKQAGTLRVGGTATAALFSLKDPTTGKVSGFDAYLAQLLAKYITGTPSVELVQVTAQTRELLLQNDTVDAVLATYTITPARAEKINFAGPYFNSGTSILVKKAEAGITKPSDLAGRTVVTQANSTAVNTLKQVVPDAKLLLLETNDQCVQALRQGRAEAYVLDQAILLGNAQRDPQVKVVGEPFTEDPYGIGLPPGDAQFKTFVNGWLTKIIEAGLWDRIWKLTVGTAIEGEPPAPPVLGSAAGS